MSNAPRGLCSKGMLLQEEENSLAKLLTSVQQRLAHFSRQQKSMHKRRKKFVLWRWMSILADSPWFSYFFMVLILINTLAMAIEYDGMSADMGQRLQQLNTTLVYAFCVELAIKVSFF
jgi:hypothetical protein